MGSRRPPRLPTPPTHTQATGSQPGSFSKIVLCYRCQGLPALEAAKVGRDELISISKCSRACPLRQGEGQGGTNVSCSLFTAQGGGGGSHRKTPPRPSLRQAPQSQPRKLVPPRERWLITTRTHPFPAGQSRARLTGMSESVVPVISVLVDHREV